MSASGPDAEGIRTLADESRQALEGLRQGLSQADQDRRERLDTLGGQATDLVEQLAAQIAGDLAQDLSAQHNEQAEATRQELEAERTALQAEREGWHAEKEEWEGVRQQIEAELAEREGKLEAAMAAHREQVEGDNAAADEVLLQKLEHAREQQENSEQQFAALHSHVGELTTALETANARLAAAAETEAQLAELQGKFDLVMADLGSHREHVAALEDQLAARPDADPADSAELTRLRSERDELAQQVEELSNQPPGAEPSEELEDLRTRFEMAVEDVRQLKNENNDLREQLANNSAATPTGGDENDWEAQKRRLLASLEGEGEVDDPDRQQERAKIEGTIQITDQVIAEKDREIERLQEQVQATAGQDADAESHAQVAAVVDADGAIQAERERLARLESEVQEKLRQAELELSVERAKNSRTQAELAEQQLELETLRATTTGGEAGGESKRRWMDKLGLGGNDK